MFIGKFTHTVRASNMHKPQLVYHQPFHLLFYLLTKITQYTITKLSLRHTCCLYYLPPPLQCIRTSFPFLFISFLFCTKACPIELFLSNGSVRGCRYHYATEEFIVTDSKSLTTNPSPLLLPVASLLFSSHVTTVPSSSP